MGDYGKFQPGPGNSMGYDDLKVIEAKKFLQSVTQGVPGACTIDDAQSAAEVVSAAVTSASTGSWVKVPAVAGRHLRRRAGHASERGGEHRQPRPVVVGLGTVDPDLVTGVLGDGIDFVAEPTEADLAAAVGAIVRADAVVDAAFLDRTPRMRVLARTGVGTDLVDLDAATARGIAVVVTPGSGTRAVAEGVLAHTLALVKRRRPADRAGQREAGGPSATPAARSVTSTARPSGSSDTAGSAAGWGSWPRRSGCGCWPTTRSPRRPPRWRAPTSTSWSPRATC